MGFGLQRMFVLLLRGCAVDISETKLDDDAVAESVGHLLRLSDTVVLSV